MFERVLRGIQRQFFHRELGSSINDLDRLRQVLPQEGGTQGIVTIYRRLQDRHEMIEPLPGIELEERRQDVGIATLPEQMMEENAFLKRGERNDVLDVCSPARYRLFDALDLSGLQLHEWKRWVAWAGITFRPQMGRKLGERRRCEDTEHISGEAETMQLRDEPRDEQRVAAEVEEVIVPTNALQVQQLRPEASERLFERSSRCFVA